MMKSDKVRRAMLCTENGWTVVKFEFDADDNQGMVWHYGRSTVSMEEMIRLFRGKMYTIIEWQDDV